MANTKNINILLADDDKDDIFFFARALKKVELLTRITSVEDGEMLINHLLKKNAVVPDILFLDVNMPRKNGLECLIEIKANKNIKSFPIIIYSTSLNESAAHTFYENGAHYYIKKSDFNELVHHLSFVLEKLSTTSFEREPIENFILKLPIA